MDKTKVNYWVDVLLVVCLIVISITGLVLYFAFESGTQHGRTITFLGMNKNMLLPWHTYFGLAMIALMFLHFILHFNIFSGMTKNLFVKKSDKLTE